MKISLLTILCTGLLFSSGALSAQSITLKTPDRSPKAISMERVGVTDVKVIYHRPAVNKRTIWGELVPYNAVWRAGANDNTVFVCSDDVKINGQTLAAGQYGFHIIPGASKSTLIFSNNSTQWGSYSYDQAEDALRVEISNGPADYFHEYLTYEFIPQSENSATLQLVWGDRAFPFTVETDVHEAVLTQIRKDLQTKPGWTWLGWHEAANYCLANNVNLEEGLQWATRSVAINPNPNNLRVKAVLTGKTRSADDEAKGKAIALETMAADLDANHCTWKEYAAAANFAVQQESWDQGIAWADQAIKMSPNMTAMLAKATVYEKKGDMKMADKVKKEAIQKGSNAELNMYGYTLIRNGKTAEAVKVFEANAEKHPNDPNVWDSLGEGYFNNNQNEKAIAAFKKSLSLNPPDNVRTNSESYLARLGVKNDMKP